MIINTTDEQNDSGEPRGFEIRIGDMDLNYTSHQTSDPIIVLDQLLELAGAHPNDEFDAYMFRNDGTLERLSTDNQIDLRQAGIESFLVMRTDRAFRIIVDDERYDWGMRWVSGKALRAIANVPVDQAIWHERRDDHDNEIGDMELVDLDASGTEKFYSRKPTWQLKIRRKTYSFATSLVPARDALSAAGFDLDKAYRLLIVSASGRKTINIDDKIDLSEPGIEYLRVKPAVINNGEAAPSAERQFELLDGDVEFLDTFGLAWESVLDGKKRWLLIHGYELPAGFNVAKVDLALDIPPSYPSEQIDMFYCSPHVTLANGKELPDATVIQKIQNIAFQRWSRHRKNNAEWDPATDCIETHLELVEESIDREVR